MLAFTFLNPLLLWALPLCAVPIVIHLLNRRRFKTVQWGAMEYLLAALKRNRKRLRMEQWLVLLLRTLAVLLLVFLVSRPQLGGGGLIGGKTHHVVLLDDSASTTQRSGSTNLFDKEQDQVRALADKLGATRGGDLFSLVRTSRPTQPELWGQRVGPELGKQVGDLLKSFSVGDSTMDLGEQLKVTRKRAADLKEASHTEYYLVTDLRAFDWLSEDDKPRAVLVAELAAMKAEVEHLTTMAIGDREAENLAVVAVRRTDRLSMVSVPTTLAVDVQNFGLDGTAPTELAVEVDGGSRVVRPVPQLAPGQQTTIQITHTFHTAGFHRVEAQLPPSERFALDDRRALALDVVERSHVLLVDGDPAEGQNEAGTLFLAVALDPGGDSISGIEPQVVQDSALAEIDLLPYDLVWLCNVPCPSEAVVQKLEKFVAAGGGLVVFAGPQVDVARYNELLYKAGKGLLPLAFGEVAGDPDRPDHLFLSKREHAIAARFPEILELLLNRVVLVKRCLPMLEDAGSAAAVIARLHDAEGPPMLAGRPFGSGGGEVLAISITADKQWSNFPDTYANVVIVQEVHHFAAKVHDLAASNLSTRGFYRLSLDPGVFKPDVLVKQLGGEGDEKTFTAVPPDDRPAPPPGQQAPAPASALWSLDIPMTELRGFGAFAVELRGHGDVIEPRMLTRNPPTDESRLVRLLPSVFQKAFPPEVQDRVTFQEESSGFGSGTGQGEVWRFLAAALLLGLVLESLLAWRFGRR